MVVQGQVGLLLQESRDIYGRDTVLYGKAI